MLNEDTNDAAMDNINGPTSLLPLAFHSNALPMDFSVNYKTLSKKTFNKLREIIKADNLERVYNFLYKYNNQIELLILFLPFSYLVQLTESYGFMNSYRSKFIYDTLSTQDYYKICTKRNIKKKSNISRRMINISNKFNMFYNFNRFANSYTSLKLELASMNINLEDFYVDTNFVVYSCCNYYKRNKLDLENKTIKLYPKKSLKIYFSNSVSVLKVGENYDAKSYLLSTSSYQVLIDKNIYRHYSELVIIGEVFICNGFEIFVVPNKLNELNDENSLIKHRNISFENSEVVFSMGFIKYVKLTDNISLEFCYFCYNCHKLTYQHYKHSEYPTMCMKCAVLNYDKRLATVNLSGFKVLITGCRKKIGYATCLKLLRLGATVYGTSRFGNLALANFMKEHDYEKFKDRLYLSSCNFMMIEQVNSLITRIKGIGINCIINNACQTTEPHEEYLKKLEYYDGTIFGEHKLLSNKATLANKPMLTNKPMLDNKTITNWIECKMKAPIITLQHDKYYKNLDSFKDFKDLNIITNNTSWKKKIENISPKEILSANIINLIIPELLINSLKSTMGTPTFIIQVTAVEGDFSKNIKKPFHAHTNACKSGLNMLSQTINFEYSNIPNKFAYSIDPGFVSGVLPNTLSEYPLKPEDGAARILDPIIMYFSGTPLDKKIWKLKNFLPRKV